jgi:hypothetical protein
MGTSSCEPSVLRGLRGCWLLDIINSTALLRLPASHLRELAAERQALSPGMATPPL